MVDLSIFMVIGVVAGVFIYCTYKLKIGYSKQKLMLEFMQLRICDLLFLFTMLSSLKFVTEHLFF